MPLLLLLALPLTAVPAAAQEIGITLRGGATLEGELESLDETRLRIRTRDGAREIPVAALDQIELRSPRGAVDPAALALSAELEALLEVGVAGELVHVGRLDAWLRARVEALVEPARRRAWDAWPRWPLLNARGQVKGAPALDALVPMAARAARELGARGEGPRHALRLLRAIDTPAAKGVLLGLYLDPRFWEPEHAQHLVPLLLDLDDARVARVVLARISRGWEGDIPDLAWEHLPLLLRYGGVDVVEATIRLLASDGGGTASYAAWSALRYARDRRALDAAVGYLRRPMNRLDEPDEGTVEALGALVETFGADGAARLLDAAKDPRLPYPRRALAAAALSRACPAARVPTSELLSLSAEGPTARAFAEVARGLATRTDLELDDDDLRALSLGVTRLIEGDDRSLHPHALDAIRALPGLHTDAVRRALYRALRGPAEGDAAAQETLRIVEQTINAAVR